MTPSKQNPNHKDFFAGINLKYGENSDSESSADEKSFGSGMKKGT